jgi:outer membrane protein OmpA-like peptidoglycan-associated protein
MFYVVLKLLKIILFYSKYLIGKIFACVKTFKNNFLLTMLDKTLFIILFLIPNFVCAQTDYNFGITHKFIVNSFERKSNEIPTMFSDLPRGMEISLSKHITKQFHLNLPFRTGFANFQNDTTNSSFWATDIQMIYSPIISFFNPYIGTGVGIQRSNDALDWGFPINAGINFKIDKSFFVNFQLTYRKSLSDLKSSFHYGIGITFRMKEIVKPTPTQPFMIPIPTDNPINNDIVGIDRSLITLISLDSIGDYSKRKIEGLTENTFVKNDSLSLNIGKVTSNTEGVKLKNETSYKALNIQNITFEINQNKLNQKGYAILDSIVQYLNFYATASLRIEGHTDNSGSNDFNQKLSVTRADACMNYLIQKGISVNRLIVIGFGEYKPLFNNGTLLGRQKNRRVEFVSFPASQ